MKYSPEAMGYKLYGLWVFAKNGLFDKKFVLLGGCKSTATIVSRLKKAGFKDNDPLGIRFSTKGNAFNLPLFLGRFTLKEAAERILAQDKRLIPYIHELVSPVITSQLYFDGKLLFLEMWPGRGAAKKQIFNEFSDMIVIENKNIRIYRYRKQRLVENVKGKVFTAKPFNRKYLEKIAKKVIQLKPKLRILLKEFNPLLGDFFIEKNFAFQFSQMQKSKRINLEYKVLSGSYRIIKSLNQLSSYKGKKDILLDLKLAKAFKDWPKLVRGLKRFKVVYLKSITMHLAIILREYGIVTRRANFGELYQVLEMPTPKTRKALKSRKSRKLIKREKQQTLTSREQ